MTQEEGRRELQYRQSKILLRTVEQLLTPEEIELIWTELLLFYDPPTKSVETVSGSLSCDGLEQYRLNSINSDVCDETDAVTAEQKRGSAPRKDGDPHGND